MPLRNSVSLVSTSALCMAALASPAHATYSIAAVDRGSQQVGGAITSCVGDLDVGVVYGSAPGFGVVHAQALLDPFGRGKAGAVERLMQGMAPEDIVAEITAVTYDFGAASRQYGVVDLSGRAAGFTGAQAGDYKSDQQGEVGDYAYSVQGNILTSQSVLDQTAAAFEAGGCDLAERLMLALEAGAENGEGDSRCTDQGIPSDSAFIEVDLPGETAGSYLRLSVVDTAPESPLVALRAQFDAWRATHPCAAVASDAGVEVDAATTADAGGGGSTPAPDAGLVAGDAGEPPVAVAVDASSPVADTGVGTIATSSDASTSGPMLDGAVSPAGASGGCRAAAPKGSPLGAGVWLVAVAAGALWGRRRCRASTRRNVSS